mmetsp:Transcript_2031/g.6524  ORF Transcript_2031/g.6524 Transcript_2031/m.6524 type:complete len:414 (-) Transcript_2031:142-1383(-)
MRRGGRVGVCARGIELRAARVESLLQALHLALQRRQLHLRLEQLRRQRRRRLGGALLRVARARALRGQAVLQVRRPPRRVAQLLLRRLEVRLEVAVRLVQLRDARLAVTERLGGLLRAVARRALHLGQRCARRRKLRFRVRELPLERVHARRQLLRLRRRLAVRRLGRVQVRDEALHRRGVLLAHARHVLVAAAVSGRQPSLVVFLEAADLLLELAAQALARRLVLRLQLGAHLVLLVHALPQHVVVLAVVLLHEAVHLVLVRLLHRRQLLLRHRRVGRQGRRLLLEPRHAVRERLLGALQLLGHALHLVRVLLLQLGHLARRRLFVLSEFVQRRPLLRLVPRLQLRHRHARLHGVALLAERLLELGDLGRGVLQDAVDLALVLRRKRLQLGIVVVVARVEVVDHLRQLRDLL